MMFFSLSWAQLVLFALSWWSLVYFSCLWYPKLHVPLGRMKFVVFLYRNSTGFSLSWARLVVFALSWWSLLCFGTPKKIQAKMDLPCNDTTCYIYLRRTTGQDEHFVKKILLQSPGLWYNCLVNHGWCALLEKNPKKSQNFCASCDRSKKSVL